MHSITDASRPVNLPSLVARKIRDDLQHQITLEPKLKVATVRAQVDLTDCPTDKCLCGLRGGVDWRGQTKLMAVVRARPRQAFAADEAPKTLHCEHLRIAKPEPPSRWLAERNVDNAATAHPIQTHVSVFDSNCVNDSAHAAMSET